MATTQSIVDEMVRRIVSRFHPEKVILFGSMARGEETPDSDADFLVIVREVEDRRALRIAIRRELSGMGLPKDVVVLTAEEFAAKRSIPGTIAYPADKEGRVLYAV